jgi:probable HAF family extracellular repeat protein
MRLRIGSPVVPWSLVAVAPALALAAGGCGNSQSCTTARTCPNGGRAGYGGSADEAGSGQAALGGGGTSGTGSGGNGTGGSRTGAAGEGGDGGASGDEAAGSAGRGGAGGSSGRAGGESGVGGEGGAPVDGPDPCEGVTCEQGVCTNVDGERACDCEPGFTGQRCELPTFEWIELLPGHDRVLTAVLSENGTVLGRSCQADDCSTTAQGFRWTHQEGSSAFGGSGILGFTDVNQDASVVVGYLRETADRNRAFTWTEASGFVNLGILPGGDASLACAARGVSADGSVIVGVSGGEPVRWTLGSEMVKLVLPSGRPSNSPGEAIAVSDDGSIVAGNLLSSPSNLLRWTATGEVEWIEPSRYAFAIGMSADGEVIVGSAAFAGVVEAFRWTRLGGLVSLGRPTDCPYTESSAVSGDGRIVAVYCSALDGERQYLWDVDGGFRPMEGVLESLGADVSDADAIGVSRLSFDGSTILGFVHPQGTAQFRPWIARLPAARDL